MPSFERHFSSQVPLPRDLKVRSAKDGELPLPSMLLRALNFAPCWTSTAPPEAGLQTVTELSSPTSALNRKGPHQEHKGLE